MRGPVRATTLIVAGMALFFSGGIPTRQPGSVAAGAERGQPARGEALT
jgi:hypothetical protein